MLSKRLFGLLCWLSFIVTVFFVLQMPETVPTHWNIKGEIDGYGSRYVYLFIGLLPLLTYYGMALTRKIDPKQDRLNTNPKVYELFRNILSMFMVLLNGVCLYSVFNPSVDVGMLTSIPIGVLFIIMGNYMPQIPQNYFLGVRFPWAIDNEIVWKKTQRVGGYSFIVSGIILIIAGMIKSTLFIYVVLAVCLFDILGVGIYSYLVYKKVSQNK